MIPVFANSAWVTAPERLILQKGRWQRRRLRVRYGVFVHPSAGPVLIDTGYTAHSVSAPGRSLMLRAYSRALAPTLVADAQPDRFLAQVGLGLQDIKTVIITHFHADHISGLSAFPGARLVCSRAAWADLHRSSRLRNLRHGIFPELLPDDIAARLALVEDLPRAQVPHLPDGHDLFGDGSVLAIPLPGHAAGHLGVLFAHRDIPLLYATDAQWVMAALPSAARPRIAPRMIADDFSAMHASADQVDQFRKAGGAVVLCHDDAQTPFDVETGASP